MNKIKILYAVFGTLVCCCSTAAQEMYKSVGPDGKVTFSDRPPSSDKAKVSVMKASVLRPLEGPPPAQPKIAPPAGLASGQNGAPAAGGMSNGIPSPELQHAMLVVMLMSEVAGKFEPVCTSAAPQSKKFMNAANGWKQRNGTFIEQQKRATSDMAPAKRAALQGEVAAKINEAMTEVVALSTPGRVKWCDKATLDMSSGLNDVANNAAVAVPLITYKSR